MAVSVAAATRSAENTPAAWRVVIDWRLPGMTAGLVAVVCAGFVAFPIFLIATLPGARPGPSGVVVTPLSTQLGMGLVAAVALGAIYMMLARFLNRSVVSVAGETLRVAVGPLPWTGRRRMALSDVVGVAVREREERRKVASVTRWDLLVTLRGGRTVPLLWAMRPHQEAAVRAAEAALKATLAARAA